ncbi:MAG TPA: phosphatidylglycerophosphatase A [Nitrospirota bacterium]|nr:phosphatidylglycerophosphatase A [Nitrospirota bacterium]
MSKVSDTVVLFIAEGVYSGKSPFAPGTAGTLVGVLLYWGLKNVGPFPYIILTCLLCIAGTWVAGRAEVLLAKRDSPSIVIDEIAGYLISMFLAPAGWGFIVAGFCLFRIFDVLKPWPLYDLQAVHGGFGVMLDDIGAGVYTNILLHIVAYFINR